MKRHLTAWHLKTSSTNERCGFYHVTVHQLTAVSRVNLVYFLCMFRVLPPFLLCPRLHSAMSSFPVLLHFNCTNIYYIVSQATAAIFRPCDRPPTYMVQTPESSITWSRLQSPALHGPDSTTPESSITWRPRLHMVQSPASHGPDSRV